MERISFHNSKRGKLTLNTFSFYNSRAEYLERAKNQKDRNKTNPSRSIYYDDVSEFLKRNTFHTNTNLNNLKIKSLDTYQIPESREHSLSNKLRKDCFGTEIRKGKKFHKTTFSEKNLVEIITIKNCHKIIKALR